MPVSSRPVTIILAVLLALLALGLGGALILAVHGTVPTALISNPGFEDGKIGEPASGWLNGGEWAGYPARLSDARPRTGRLCGFLASDPSSRVRDYGVLSQMIETTQLKNQFIRLRLAARSELRAPDGRANFFCRVDRISEQPLFEQRSINDRRWRDYVVILRVPKDAIRMQMGVTLINEGKVWVDDAGLDLWRRTVPRPWIQFMRCLH